MRIVNCSVEDLREVPPADCMLFSYTHDVLQSPKAIERLVASAKPGCRLAILGARPIQSTNSSGVIIDTTPLKDNDPRAILFGPGKDGLRPIDTYLRRMATPGDGKSPSLAQPDRLAAIDLAQTVSFDRLDKDNIPEIKLHFENYLILATDGKSPAPAPDRPPVLR